MGGERTIVLTVHRGRVSTNDASSRFSLVGFAVALVTVGVGAAAGLAFVPVVGTYVGMLAGGFVAGLAVEARPTVESGVAAALASLGVLVAGALPGSGVVAAVLSLLSLDPMTLLLGVALSFAVGAFGGHFGDDLRDGLTEPLPREDATPTSQGAATRSSTTATLDTDATDAVDAEDATALDDLEPAGASGERSGREERVDREKDDVDREHTEFELEDD